MMKRRNFFSLAVGAAVGLALAPLDSIANIISPRVILYGDGVHDDTAAVQAWIRNENVYWADGTKVANVINNQFFRFTDTISLDYQPQDREIHNVVCEWDDIPVDGCMWSAMNRPEGSAALFMNHCIFNNRAELLRQSKYGGTTYRFNASCPPISIANVIKGV